MGKFPKILVKSVGIIGGLTAIYGIFYNLSMLSLASYGSFSEVVKKTNLTYFYLAFYTMSCVCIACYILLLLCSIDLFRMRFRLFWLFNGILAFELIYFIAIAMLWLTPFIGMSVGAATGVANGGLMMQFIILFPLWAPLVLVWAKKKLEHEARQQVIDNIV